ncbi:MAG: nucleoside hydrolase [Candidatus Yanofskybacteria bacterium]|nr:nucleoside hydrolase [Candidatus Yanofskybacteria bacterium]
MDKKKIILDTDIGYDPDDLFALLLALKSPEVEIALIVTADEVLNKRTTFTRNVLKMTGNQGIEVVSGIDLGNHKNFVVDELLKDHKNDAGGDYINSMKKVADSVGKITYVGIGGFTNLAKFFKVYPDYVNTFEIYMMGGAINYSRREGWIEHNIRLDKEAARYIINDLDCNISLIMAQTTFQQEYEVNPDNPIFKKLKDSNEPVHKLLVQNIELFNKKTSFWPKMHDPLTFATAIGKDFVTLHKSTVFIDEKGKMSLGSNGKEIYWSDPVSKKKEFMDFLEESLFS